MEIVRLTRENIQEVSGRAGVAAKALEEAYLEASAKGEDCFVWVPKFKVQPVRIPKPRKPVHHD